MYSFQQGRNSQSQKACKHTVKSNEGLNIVQTLKLCQFERLQSENILSVGPTGAVSGWGGQGSSEWASTLFHQTQLALHETSVILKKYRPYAIDWRHFGIRRHKSH